MTTANKRIAIVPKGLRYQKVTQTRVSGGKWLPKFGGMASASREKAFRHVWSKRGDRRLGLFQFRITRDDGIILDHTQLYTSSSGIWIYQWTEEYQEIIGRAHGYFPVEDPDDAEFWTLDGDIWYYCKDDDPEYIVEFSYNTKTQIWTVPFLTWPGKKPKKGRRFWVTFSCEDSVLVEYLKPLVENPRYIYEEGEFFNPEDYIKPKFYEVLVPYYKEISKVRTPPPEESPTGYCGGPTTDTYCYEGTGNVVLTIQSSIPYTVRYATLGLPTAAYWGKYRDSCGDVSCAECQIIAEASDARWLYVDPPGSIVAINAIASATTTHGDSSANIETDPIDSEHIVAPTPYTVEEGVFNITVNYAGPSQYELILDCLEGGSTSFFLDFKLVRAGIYISAVSGT